jgi:hypothetical protein
MLLSGCFDDDLEPLSNENDEVSSELCVPSVCCSEGVSHDVMMFIRSDGLDLCTSYS